MSKFNIPKRNYCDGPKKMVSMRLPVRLIETLENISKEKGWNLTDLVSTALDQYAQWEKGKKD